MGVERSQRTWLDLPSLLNPMDNVRTGAVLRLMSKLVDIGYEVASVLMPRPRCAALKFRLQWPGRSHQREGRVTA